MGLPGSPLPRQKATRRSREALHRLTGGGSCLGPLTGVLTLGSRLGEPHKLTAKFVHSAVEGFGLIGAPGSGALLIYRSEVCQDPDEAWEVHGQIPGGGGRQWSPGPSLCLGPQPLPSPRLSPLSSVPACPACNTSPFREKAVYDAVP